MRLDTEVKQAQYGVYHVTMRAQHYASHPQNVQARPQNPFEPGDAHRALVDVSQQRASSS